MGQQWLSKLEFQGSRFLNKLFLILGNTKRLTINLITCLRGMCLLTSPTAKHQSRFAQHQDCFSLNSTPRAHFFPLSHLPPQPHAEAEVWAQGSRNPARCFWHRSGSHYYVSPETKIVTAGKKLCRRSRYDYKSIWTPRDTNKPTKPEAKPSAVNLLNGRDSGRKASFPKCSAWLCYFNCPGELTDGFFQ